MYKSLFLTLSTLVACCLVSNQLGAFDGIRTLDICNAEGKCNNKFVFSAPKNWHQEEEKGFFDAKFTHDLGNRTCYLSLSCFDEAADKGLLFREIMALGENLYGQEFWKNPKYDHMFLDNTDISCLLLFDWSKESGWFIKTNDDHLAIYAFKEPVDDHCTRCIAIVYNDKDARERLLQEDLKSFIASIRLFKTGQ